MTRQMMFESEKPYLKQTQWLFQVDGMTYAIVDFNETAVKVKKVDSLPSDTITLGLELETGRYELEFAQSPSNEKCSNANLANWKAHLSKIVNYINDFGLPKE